ncbi:hypothetical protein brsh051_10930 [Brooklawnia propionicigenes]|uniref:Uncharacterized protein n=1 Tax=Brooklawnia propionicigenes TaxID=3041175 RepID=A0AAN0MG05_9ACTN|nr:hypothetical protein brsh051_10930 [Brooklawnia sp. SH051]
MIMPNIPALIAWGLLTAFFIPVGWVPNESFAAARSGAACSAGAEGATAAVSPPAWFSVPYGYFLP